jgi:transcriptional regulator of acetoin/glycerol metabolism
MRDSGGDSIGHEGDAPPPASKARAEEAPGPTLDDLRASLAAAEGNLSRTARALGLPSRYALYRLMRKHGIDVSAVRVRDEG